MASAHCPLELTLSSPRPFRTHVTSPPRPVFIFPVSQHGAASGSDSGGAPPAPTSMPCRHTVTRTGRDRKVPSRPGVSEVEDKAGQ